MRQRICPICGSNATRVTPDVRDRVTGDGFAVVACARCGFASTEPVPPDLARHYPTRYRRPRGIAAWALRSVYRRRVAEWLRRLGSPGVALEIGSGPGWMLRALREGGWKAIGTERTVRMADAARAWSGAPVFVGDIAAVKEAPIADVIVMFHVLEHLADPLAQLRGVAGRLRAGGTVVLGLPNLASWQARAAGRDWRHLDVPRHLVHFTPASIEIALRAAGLRLTRITFRSLEHDPLGWVQAVLDRLGLPQGALSDLLLGERDLRSAPLATVLSLGLAVPLMTVALPLAVVSWLSRRGAVMEVWAVKDRT